MKFGRIDDLDAADLSLPPDAPGTNTVLQRHPQQTPEVYIGCPLWADKSFVGKVYPKSAKQKDYLRHYARQFNAIELNSTHYNIPSPATVRQWREAVPHHFRFFPKFANTVSHRNDFGAALGALDRFLEAIQGFGEQLGTAFLQMPPYFAPDRMPALRHFLETLPTDKAFAIEVRHQAWFADSLASAEYFQMLEDLGITTVITDAPARRDVVHQRLTTPVAFVRFLAHNLHPSDYQRIDAWADRLGQWFDAGLQAVAFFMHQPEKHFCADITQYMIGLLNQRHAWQGRR